MGHAANAEPSSIAAARAAHTELYEGVLSFFGEYDMLVTPTVILPPYDMDLRYPSRLGKVQFGNYLDWMVLSWALTVTQCPAMSVPVGFTSAGLPVGLQIVSKPFAEPTLLAAAAAFEAAHPAVAAATPCAPRARTPDLKEGWTGRARRARRSSTRKGRAPRSRRYCSRSASCTRPRFNQ